MSKSTYPDTCLYADSEWVYKEEAAVSCPWESSVDIVGLLETAEGGWERLSVYQTPAKIFLIFQKINN